MSKELGPPPGRDYERLDALFARLSLLSPRDCAVVATSAVDSLLEDLLRAGMREDVPSQMFQGFGPLASLSAKIEVAYGFCLISAGEKQELHLLRKVRNDFAHSWASSGSFDEAPIAD